MRRTSTLPRDTIGWALGLAALVAFNAHADNFVAARYEPKSDELVITMRYRGTNADHGFAVTWGACQQADPASAARTISASVLDDQWRDAARSTYEKTFRVPLADIPCRPVKVTLHTAPRFYVTVNVPGAAP